MKIVFSILDKLLGKRLSSITRQHLDQLATAPTRVSQSRLTSLLKRLSARPKPHVRLGETESGEEIMVPLADVARLHGLVTGGSGSGKTMMTLLKVNAILEAPEDAPIGCAVLDGAKSDLYLGALFLLKRRLEKLSKSDPSAASRLRRRVRIIDFAATDAAVTSFNLLARWPDAAADAFANHQVDLLLDLLPGGETLTLAAVPLKSLVQVLSAPEVGMSIVDLIRILEDEPFLNAALARCSDSALVRTLVRQLSTLSRSTRAALRRRLEVLVSASTVARMLAGRTAPDFRRFQDEVSIVLVNSAGPNISGGLTRFLNTLVVSYFCRSIYTRRQPDLPFVIIPDEAQDLFASSIMRQHLSDAGRLSRSYGTHFWFITQNLFAAVPDARLIRLLHTNIGWTWSGRGDPDDCAFLKPVLPITGRRVQPKRTPFEETRCYSPTEERLLLLQEVAGLPNRTGYYWLKGQACDAIKMRTADLDLPQGTSLEKAVLSIRNNPSIGQRLSRKEYDRLLAELKHDAPADDADVDASLEQAYWRTRDRNGDGQTERR